MEASGNGVNSHLQLIVKCKTKIEYHKKKTIFVKLNPKAFVARFDFVQDFFTVKGCVSKPTALKLKFIANKIVSDKSFLQYT
jgi:hypothetical protein